MYNIVSGEFTVYALWEDSTTGQSFRLGESSLHSVLMAVKPLVPSKNISKNSGFSGFPQLAVSGSNVYAVWYDETSGNGDIFFAAGTDFGLNFDTPTNLSNNPGFSGFPKITVGEGKSVYIVWTDNTPGNLDIFVASSINGGLVFILVNVSNNIQPSAEPQIAASFGNNVYVVWHELCISSG